MNTIILYLLFIALFFRLLLLILKRKELILSDSKDYHDLAISLTKGKYQVPGTKLDEFRTPGYPFFVSLIYRIFPGQIPVYLVQILLNVGSIYLTYMIGWMLFSQVAGMLAACILILEPDFLYYVYDLLTDTLYTFLFLLSIYLVLIYDHTGGMFYVILTGLTLSAMTYIKPGSFMLPVFYCFVLPLDHITWLAGFYLAPLIPWFMRNYLLYGHFKLCSIATYNLFAYNAAEPNNIEAYLVKADRVNHGFEMNDYLKKKATNKIVRHPQVFCRNVIKGLYRQYFSATWHLCSNRFIDGSDWPQKALTISKGNKKYITRSLIVMQIIYLVSLYGLTLWGMTGLIETRIGIMLTGIILYMGLLPAGAGHPRYKVPLIPLFLLIAINAIL